MMFSKSAGASSIAIFRRLPSTWVGAGSRDRRWGIDRRGDRDLTPLSLFQVIGPDADDPESARARGNHTPSTVGKSQPLTRAALPATTRFGIFAAGNRKACPSVSLSQAPPRVDLH